MNRRNLLSAIAGLPFLGWLAPAESKGLRVKSLPHTGPIGDGVALNSISHPYAVDGETVTCEMLHPICDFVKTVWCGEIQNLPVTLGNWRQPEPMVGQRPMPRCAVCGGRFAISGGIFHIGDRWRDPEGLICRYGIPEND